MKKIYKYPVQIQDYFAISLPRGAEILTVQTQHKVPQLWALVDPEEDTIERNFRLVGTGHEIPVDLYREGEYKHIGTFQMHNGALVFHLFELV